MLRQIFRCFVTFVSIRYIPGTYFKCILVKYHKGRLYIRIIKLLFFVSFFKSLGPMIWYQKFEYAISHWLQKATEHLIGCVLCSPGCFSLFRASALMDDNVMGKYATLSSQARHYVQYDQGML